MADSKNTDSKTAESSNNQTASDNRNKDMTDREADTTSVYDSLPEKDPTVNPDEEVTPGNVQAPLDDEDKLKQDNVLLAQHVEQGYPANMIPRTDEERERMKKDGLIQ